VDLGALPFCQDLDGETVGRFIGAALLAAVRDDGHQPYERSPDHSVPHRTYSSLRR
jgi:hypothetical protein